MTRSIFLPLVMLAAMVGCKDDKPLHSKEEVAAFAAKVESVRSKAKMKTAEWHSAMSEAIAHMAILGDKCPVTDYYPVEYFDLKAWHGVNVREWSKDAKPNLAMKASEQSNRQEESLNSEYQGMLRHYGEKLDHFDSEEYWDYDLTLLQLTKHIPEQAGHTGKHRGGALLVRAFLYSHQEKKVICEGIYQVGTGESVSIEYTTFGTASERASQRAQMDAKNLGAREMAMAVDLDLRRKAYYSANSHLKVVTERTSKPFPMEPEEEP